MQLIRKTFHVIGEHTFGLVSPEQPDTLQILASKPSRGATYLWQDGMCPFPSEGTRPATRADFEDFRVMSKGYESAPEHYDFPTL